MIFRNQATRHSPAFHPLSPGPCWTSVLTRVHLGSPSPREPSRSLLLSKKTTCNQKRSSCYDGQQPTDQSLSEDDTKQIITPWTMLSTCYLLTPVGFAYTVSHRKHFSPGLTRFSKTSHSILPDKLSLFSSFLIRARSFNRSLQGISVPTSQTLLATTPRLYAFSIQ